LQDGVPLNLADGGFDMQSVEPLAVSYTEVFRGANALRYGSTSLGGAINFVSPTGYDSSWAQARAEFGSFGYNRAQVSSGGVAGKFDYYATVTHLSQDGFRVHSQQNNQRVFSNFGVRLNAETENRTFVTFVDTDSELPGSITKAQMYANPRRANAGNVALDQKRDFQLFRLANRTAWKRDNNEAEFSAWWSYKDLDHPIFQVIDQLSNDFGFDARYRNTSELFGLPNRFTVGFRPTYGWAEDNRYVNFLGTRGARTGDATLTSYNLDFYLEDQLQVAEKLTAVVGLQISYANRDFKDAFLTDGNQTDNQDYFGANPKFGFIYDFKPGIQFYGNVSRSFEPPSFGELVRPPGPGIINGLVQLDDQTAWTVEFGTRGEAGRFGWDVTFYHSWIKNELLSVGLPNIPNSTVTFNADQTTHMGVELGFNVRVAENLFSDERDGKFGDSITLRNAYLWNHFRFNGDPVFGDNDLPGIPENYYRAEIFYQHRCGFYFGPNVEWSISDFAIDMANTFFNDSYVLFNVRLGYRSPKGFDIFFDARNLTDEIFAATTGVIRNAGGVDAAQFLPGDGRAFYGGVEWKF
jgi:iron complex outermembrane receptor protein